jgi:hypothetical protein
MTTELRSSLATTGAFILVIGMALSIGGCRRGTSGSNDDIDTSTYKPEPTPATEFEQKLKFVQDAHFQHVWIFTRKDGKEFDKADSDTLHANAPKVVDWVRANEGKTFIAGSNFDIDAPQMAVLQKRYKIEDYSGK